MIEKFFYFHFLDLQNDEHGMSYILLDIKNNNKLTGPLPLRSNAKLSWMGFV